MVIASSATLYVILAVLFVIGLLLYMRIRGKRLSK
jgi:hypothetical protein